MVAKVVYVYHNRLMKKLTAFVIVGVLAVTAVTGVVYAQTIRLYTLNGFTEMLIARNLVPASLAEKARELSNMVSRIDDAEDQAPVPVGAKNSDKVTVSVSQLIEHANLEFKVGENIEGLLLIVKNNTASTTELEAKRRCQVVYRIYSADDVLLYDSATGEKCVTDEKVTYLLNAQQTRMFPINHAASTFGLSSGTYRFVLEYPGYGKGERTVTIR